MMESFKKVLVSYLVAGAITMATVLGGLGYTNIDSKKYSLLLILIAIIVYITQVSIGISRNSFEKENLLLADLSKFNTKELINIYTFNIFNIFCLGIISAYDLEKSSVLFLSILFFLVTYSLLLNSKTVEFKPILKINRLNTVYDVTHFYFILLTIFFLAASVQVKELSNLLFGSLFFVITYILFLFKITYSKKITNALILKITGLTAFVSFAFIYNNYNSILEPLEIALLITFCNYIALKHLLVVNTGKFKEDLLKYFVVLVITLSIFYFI